VAAALEEFAARGFAAARLEDVARRAGVGKGTIYLHFLDKEALFRELVTTMLVPFIANIEAVPPAGLPIRVVLERLIDLFIREVEGRCPELTLASPRDGRLRGSQVSFRHPEGYAIMQALIARGVIGDFRAPDLLRFGFTPLYSSYADVWDAVEHLKAVLESGEWKAARYNERAAVT